MWRFALIVILAVSAVFVSPVQRSEAGFAVCVGTAQDIDIDVFGFNYLWAAGAACIGEDWEKAHVSVHAEYYDWDEEGWRYLADIGSAVSHSDDRLLAWGAESVGPYLGINCRRIKALFNFTHSGREFVHADIISDGKCY